MSGPFAIAAASYVLRNMLMNGLADPDVDLSIFGGSALTVTAHPPDLIQVGANEAAQLNLFLYQVTPNAALRNTALPSRAGNGVDRLTNPPLALDLHYLLTAYGGQELHPESLLGYGMQVLHEVPFLSRDMIRAALPVGTGTNVQKALAASALADQLEYLKICPQTMTTEEMSKLWTAFQAKYRPSAAYVVTVVLIESKLPARSALPVLQQGNDARGPTAVGGSIPPYPEIDNLVLPKNQPAALLGDAITIQGHDFADDQGNPASVNVTVRLSNDRLRITRDVPVLASQRTTDAITFTLPDEPANLPAGVYTLAVLVTSVSEPLNMRSSNAAPLLIAPRITTAMPATFAAGAITLALSPQVQPGQRASLLLGSREFVAKSLSTPSASVDFDVSDMPQSTYRARVRIDGVDSLLVDRSDPKHPAFDDKQQITLT